MPQSPGNLTSQLGVGQSRAQRSISLGLKGAGRSGGEAEGRSADDPFVRTDAPHDTSLDSIQQQLERLIAQSQSASQIELQFVQLACSATNAIWSGLFAASNKANEQQSLACVAEHNGVAQQNLGLARSSLLPAVEEAMASGKVGVRESGDLTVVAVPVFVSEAGIAEAQQCLSLALNLQGQPAEPFVLVAQMVSAYLGRYLERQVVSKLDWQIDATAAVAELMAEVANATRPQQATMLATNHLARFLSAHQVAIGLVRKSGSRRTKIASVSGTTEIDAGGETARRLQDALNESLIRESPVVLPVPAGDDRSMTLAHQQLLSSQNDTVLVSSPLTTSSGETIGAWLCVLPATEANHENAVQFVKTVSGFLADALAASKRATAGPVSRLKQQVTAFATGRTGLLALLGSLVVAGVLAIPVPHRITCQGTLQPTLRRFAVAPHDGILLDTTVKPGDMVTAGQVVARMDDRELELELLDLLASRKSAWKKRDVNRSGRDAAATQISEFEVNQLDARINLIRFKQQNLEIRSVVAGIVLQGDLQDARGAPVRTGDVLMEIGPLKDLKLEIDVPEADVQYVQQGQLASVVLDGNPFQTIEGPIDSIRPMAEIRDGQNVFVSELLIENDARLLRPGMRGRVKISNDYRALGWVMFHQPCERVYSVFR